jgi:hypothetical protein
MYPDWNLGLDWPNGLFGVITQSGEMHSLLSAWNLSPAVNKLHHILQLPFSDLVFQHLLRPLPLEYRCKREAMYMNDSMGHKFRPLPPLLEICVHSTAVCVTLITDPRKPPTQGASSLSQHPKQGGCLMNAEALSEGERAVPRSRRL